MASKGRLSTLQPRAKPMGTARAQQAPNRWGNGRGGRPWRRIRDAVAARDLYTCQLCGRVTEEGDADHIKPISQGGTDDMDNLQWLCREPCHKDKTTRESGGKPKTEIGEDGWPK